MKTSKLTDKEKQKHDKYVKYSQETSAILEKHLNEFCAIHKEFIPIQQAYTNKKLHLNGVQFRAGFEAVKSSENWEKYKYVPMAIELVMIWAYKTNKIVDRKNDAWKTEESVKKIVLEHDLILALILELLENSRKALGKKFDKLNQIISRMLGDMVKGFWVERNTICLNKKPLEIIKKNWAENYKKRNIYFDLVYDFSPLVGYWLASGDEKIFEKYESFFEDKYRFSHAGQIINDMSDYICVYDKYTKSYQDQFSDLRNKVVTYPAFCLIENTAILNALKDSKITLDKEWQKDIALTLSKKKVVESVMTISKKSFEQHSLFWKKMLKENNEILLETYSMLRINKYFKFFQENQKKKS